MKVLVTGSSGFIGKHLVDRMKNHTVFMYDLGDSFPNTGVDIVFHLASKVNAFMSVSEPTQGLENIELTFKVLEWMRKTKTQNILFTSSREVYSMVNPYGVSKKCSELIIKNYVDLYGITAVSARLANIYGEGNLEYRFIENTIEKVKKNQDIVIYGGSQKILNFVHIDDCLDKLVSFADIISNTSGYQVFDVASDKSWKLVDVLKVITNQFNYTGTVTFDENRRGETLVYEPNRNQLLIKDKLLENVINLCSQS